MPKATPESLISDIVLPLVGRLLTNHVTKDFFFFRITLSTKYLLLASKPNSVSVSLCSYAGCADT